MEIIWRGTDTTNKSSRKGEIPFIIVDHISGGTWDSCDDWFRGRKNKESSAHFCVAKDGTIRQYVKIEDAAWANGITAAGFQYVTAELVKNKGKGQSVNRYTVSIEHEGTDGNLTETQFQATVWLHKYIKDYVKKIWGLEMSLDRKHVVGHYEINPIDRPYCPGKYFPWNRLMKELQNDSFPILLQKFKDKGIVGDSTYWVSNCQEGKFVEGKYANIVIKRFVAMFKICNTFDEVCDYLKTMEVIKDASYWKQKAIEGGQIEGQWMKKLIENMSTRF